MKNKRKNYEDRKYLKFWKGMKIEKNKKKDKKPTLNINQVQFDLKHVVFCVCLRAKVSDEDVFT